MSVRAWVPGLAAVAIAGLIMLMGCAATEETTKPTPEELKARQDSIAKANERQLKISRMFAYDKLKQKQWQGAKKYLWEVVDLDVKDQYNEWDRLYQVYMETDKPDSAEIVLEMGLERHPNDSFLNATYGFILKAKGQYEQALMHYEKALEGDPDNVEYLRKKAEIHQSLNQPDEAIASYEKLLQIESDDQPAKDALTALVREHRDPAEYIERLEQETRDHPDNLLKRMDLMRAYQDQNMNREVVREANEILERDPGRLEVYRATAKAYDNLNQLQNAINTYRALLEQNPGNGGVMLRIADNLQQLDRFAEARGWIVRAKRNGASTGEADYILGLTYEASGDACSGGGLKYDDKLVYTIAYGLFQKAAASDDYNIKGKAQSRVGYMEQFVPKKSDWFLNQGEEMPEKDCYGWIKPPWPETDYIKTFLKRYEG